MGTSTRFAACLAVMSAAMAAMLFLPACCSSSYRTPDERLAAEFRWNKYSEVTPKRNIPVAFPIWLTKPKLSADRSKVLEYIDLYADKMIEFYPWAGENFDFSAYKVWIHDNPGGFVAGSPSSPTWASGWHFGGYCAVCWGLSVDESGRPCTLTAYNILPALIHEWFHAMLKVRYGTIDAGHFLYFPTPEVQNTLRRAYIFFNRVLDPLILSDEALWGALHFKYHPWLYPGKIA